MLGKGDKAVELYKMITPIEHARTKDAANKYKVEPYVLAADVYGAQNLAGSGGWTWYTGSSSWYYLAGIQYILGLNIYNIKVKNPNGKNTGISQVLIDGNEHENKIILDSSGKVFNVEIIM